MCIRDRGSATQTAIMSSCCSLTVSSTKIIEAAEKPVERALMGSSGLTVRAPGHVERELGWVSTKLPSAFAASSVAASQRGAAGCVHTQEPDF